MTSDTCSNPQLEGDLRAFHARHPGASGLVFGYGRCADGRTSYARLAELAHDHDRVLDVGCGDGTLLAAVRKRVPDAELVGVDMSGAELAIAADRVPGARLHRARAQELPLPDGSVDLLLSHMALMLMDPIEPVVAELARVLRPGGRLAVIVGGHTTPTSAQSAFFPLLHRRMFDDGKRWGDERCHSADGLRSLFTAGWRDVRVEDLQLEVEVPVEQAWSFLERAYYPVDALPDDAKAELRAEVLAHLPEWAEDGLVPWRFGMRELRAIRG